MEYELCQAVVKTIEAVTRNLLSQRSNQNLSLCLIYAGTYIVSAYFIKTKDAIKTLISILIGQVFSASVMFSMADDYHGSVVYIFYAVICFNTILFLSDYKVIRAWFIMGLFDLAMAIDTYVNPTAQTFIWQNYEYITTCIHVLIVVSLVRWNRQRSDFWVSVYRVLRAKLHYSLLLPYRG